MLMMGHNTSVPSGPALPAPVAAAFHQVKNMVHGVCNGDCLSSTVPAVMAKVTPCVHSFETMGSAGPECYEAVEIALNSSCVDRAALQSLMQSVSPMMDLTSLMTVLHDFEGCARLQASYQAGVASCVMAVQALNGTRSRSPAGASRRPYSLLSFRTSLLSTTEVGRRTTPLGDIIRAIVRAWRVVSGASVIGMLVWYVMMCKGTAPHRPRRPPRQCTTCLSASGARALARTSLLHLRFRAYASTDASAGGVLKLRCPHRRDR